MDPRPLPPPLPKKILARARSLPTHRVFSPSLTPAGKPPRLLQGSHSVDKSPATDDEVRPACPPAELPFCSLDTELGLSLHYLHCPEAVHAELEVRQLEGLCSVHTRLWASSWRAVRDPAAPTTASVSWTIFPVWRAGDTLYYCMVQMDKEVWHVLAAKVSPTTGPPPPQRAPQLPVLGLTHTCSLGSKAYFGTNRN